MIKIKSSVLLSPIASDTNSTGRSASKLKFNANIHSSSTIKLQKSFSQLKPIVVSQSELKLKEDLKKADL